MKKVLLIIAATVITIITSGLSYIFSIGIIEYVLKSQNNIQLTLLFSFFPTMIIYPLIACPVFNFLVFLTTGEKCKGIFKISNKFDGFFDILSIPWFFMGMWMPLLLVVLLKIKTTMILLLLAMTIFGGILYPLGCNILRLVFSYRDIGMIDFFILYKWYLEVFGRNWGD